MRLPSARFTPEDHAVVADLVLYRRGICWLAQLLVESYESDQRDADVMFYAQQFKLADTLRVDQAGGGVLVRLPASICHNADPPEIFG